MTTFNLPRASALAALLAAVLCAGGGEAPFCQQSSDGGAVACGGKAPFCEQSSDGTKVACGGAQAL